MPGGFAKKNIRRRLVVHILVVGLLPLALGLGLTYHYGIQAIRDTIGANFETIAFDTGNRIDGLIQDEIRKLLSLGTVPIVVVRKTARANQTYQGQSSEIIRQRLLKRDREWVQAASPLRDLLKTESSYYLERLVELDYRNVIGILLTDRHGGLVSAYKAPKRYYFGDESWWRDTMKREDVYVSDILLPDMGSFETHEDTIEIALPIRDLSDNGDGPVLGTVMLSYGLSNFRAAIALVKIGETGHAMLFDSSGTLLICPTLPRERHRVNAELLKKILFPTPGWTIAFDDSHGKRNTIVGYSPVQVVNSIRGKSLNGKTWHIFIRQDPEESLAPAYSLLLKVLLLGSILVGALALSGIYVGSRITRPIRELQEGAKRIGEGHLDQPLVIRTQDELEDLAGEFNRMAMRIKLVQEELARCNCDLERKVEDRTVELKQSEEIRHEDYAKMIHAEKLASLGRMAAGMAHEIGNPLSSISALIQVLESGNISREEQASYISLLLELVNRIDLTLRHLLTFSRPSPPKLGPVDLEQTIEEAVRITTPDDRFKKIIINRRWARDLPEIRGDHGQLVQVFVNLLFNAADAASAEGRITIETRPDRESEEVMILFSDNGRGIPPEALPKVFDPFYTTKAPGRGTGLGLSICRSIIEGMRGKIEVESEVGKGTTFTSTLPIGVKTNLTKQVLVNRHE